MTKEEYNEIFRKTEGKLKEAHLFAWLKTIKEKQRGFNAGIDLETTFTVCPSDLCRTVVSEFIQQCGFAGRRQLRWKNSAGGG